MNYEETLEYLYSQLPIFQRIGAAAYKANLDNTYALMDVLSHPEKAFKCIHIAGTNGKGSSAHLLASIYQEAGYKTGLYTSPHLKDFRERIRINGEMISQAYVVDFVEEYAEAFLKISPSFFELTMAMAFQYFADQKVDMVIVETGLGGRLDSTNIVFPELSIITNIGKDHMQFLGNTLAEIANEKAGIIKSKIPVLIGERQDDIQDVFIEKAEKLSAPLFYAEDVIQFVLLDENKNIYEILDKDRSGKIQFQLPLLGKYQRKNLITVLAAARLLKIEDKYIKQGIENVIINTHLLGRWQIVSQQPLIVLDTAHNEDGLRYVMAQLEDTFYEKLHFVLGVVNDKSLEGILRLFPKSASYYFCKADIPRGLDPEILQEMATQEGLSGKVYPSVKDALLAAKLGAAKNDLIFVGGSTFTVAEAL